VNDRAPPILEARALVAGYVPEVNVLDGVGLTVRPGEVVTVVGPNGAGKSTLLRVIFGLLRPSIGQVLLRGEDITGLPPHRITRRGMSYVPQLDNVFPSLTVEENLEMGLAPRLESNAKVRMMTIYELFPRLAERRRQAAGTMSGGERQMIAIARALMPEPEILLLDEPSAGLSPILMDVIFEHISQINRSGVTILMVEQNARRALALSDRGYVLELGRNRYEGPAKTLLNDPRVGELYLGDTARNGT
jgi:neutral amino acid transport system ATP-binding protein